MKTFNKKCLEIDLVVFGFLTIPYLMVLNGTMQGSPFTIFNDQSIHLEKFKKCFVKCKEFDSLNLDRCAL